jgi:hypothetical protein
VRIRQVRPEFWTDEAMARLPMTVRQFYIGLWNVADDAGWLVWRPAHIGAVLFPYESARRREREIASWSAQLVDAGRLRLHDCGCAEIPTLPRHQRIAGKQSFAVLETHRKHVESRVVAPKGYQALSGSPVEERRVEERNGISVEELAAIRDAEDDVDRQKLAAARRLKH